MLLRSIKCVKNANPDCKHWPVGCMNTEMLCVHIHVDVHVQCI